MGCGSSQQEKKRTIMSSELENLLDQTQTIWKRRHAPVTSGELAKHFKELFSCLKQIERHPLPDKVEEMKEIGNRMVQSGTFDAAAAELVAGIHLKGQSDIDSNTNDNRKEDPVVLLSLVACASEGSEDVCDCVLQYPDLLRTLLDFTGEILQPFETSSHGTSSQKPELAKALLESVRIVHNISVYVENLEVNWEERRQNDMWYIKGTVDPLTDDLRQDIICRLQQCIKLDDDVIKLKAMFALACLANDNQGKSQGEDLGEGRGDQQEGQGEGRGDQGESQGDKGESQGEGSGDQGENQGEGIEKSQDRSLAESHGDTHGECRVVVSQKELHDPIVIQFLVENLQRALEGTNTHLSQGCSRVAMERSLRHLLRTSDENIVDLLIKSSVLEPLVRGLKEAQTDDEAAACLHSLWLLHFKEQCCQEMAKDDKLVDHLGKKKCLKETRRAKDLKEALERSRNPKKKSPKQQASNSSGPVQKHVMFSYQHYYQPLVKRIHEYLKKHDLPTWMDMGDMHKKTSIYQSMAGAVEDAAVVIVCMSESYFNSENCEKEASYSSDLKKTIIPLKLEKNYKPKGWLGIIVAGKLYFDFAKEEQFDQACQQLLETVQRAMEISSKEGEKQEGGNAGACLNSEESGTPKRDEEDVVACEIASTVERDDEKTRCEAHQKSEDLAKSSEENDANETLDGDENDDEGPEAGGEEHATETGGGLSNEDTTARMTEDNHEDPSQANGEVLSEEKGATETSTKYVQTDPQDQCSACRGISFSSIPVSPQCNQGNQLEEPSSVQHRHSSHLIEVSPKTSEPPTRGSRQLVRSLSVPEGEGSSLDSLTESALDSSVSRQYTLRKDSQRKLARKNSTSTTRQDLISRLVQFGLKRKDLVVLSEKDLRYLVRFKYKAPEAYFKTWGTGLTMSAAFEVLQFSEAMRRRPSSTNTLSSDRSMTIVHCTF